MTVDILVLGAGGHAKVLIDCLKTSRNIRILGIVDINPNQFGKKILGIPVLGNEEEVFSKYSPVTTQLINGIGSVSLPERREKIFNQYKRTGYIFFNVIHQTAYIGKEVVLGESVQIMAGSTIQTGSYIGNNVIINTHAAIDHDCHIGDHVHLAPGVVCCGEVTIGTGTHIGCGAVIRQGVKIAENCVIAAGAVVICDVKASSKVAGVPAKIME